MTFEIAIFERWKTWGQCKRDIQHLLEKSTLGKIEEAFYFTQERVNGQLRVNGEQMVFHFLEVLEILIYVSGVRDQDLLSASVLHDILEDTPTKEEEIESQFGAKVHGLVLALSRRNVNTVNGMNQTKEAYLKGIQKQSRDVKLIKLADRYSNVQKLSKDPDHERQKKYYRQTVNYIIPIAHEFQEYQELFREWKRCYSYLKDTYNTDN